MDILSSGTNIFLIVIGFGLLITVHELGHFIAARWAGIRVEGFAVGMGPALLSYRRGIGLRLGSTDHIVKARTGKEPSALSLEEQEEHGIGETEYSLRMFPLGGYVKMLGQEDGNPGAVSKNPRSYGERPVGKRMIVVSAGVFMNLLAAVVMFVIAFMAGVRFEAPTVGDVLPDSPAAVAISKNPQIPEGLMPGDRILSIDGEPTRTFSDLLIASAMSVPGEPLAAEVERSGFDTPLHFTINPDLDEASGLRQIGVMHASNTTLADTPELLNLLAWSFVEAGGSSEDASALTGWRIASVNGNDIETWAELGTATTASDGGPLRLTWTPPAGSSEPPREQTLHPLPQLQVLYHDTSLGTEFANGLLGLVPLVKIASVLPDGPNVGILEAGDVVLSVDEIEGPRNAQFREAISKNPGKSVRLQLLRNGKTIPVEAQVNRDGRIGVHITDAMSMPVIARPIDQASAEPGGEQTPTPAAGLGLLPRTRVDQVGGIAVTDWPSIRSALLDATAEAAANGTDAKVEMTWSLPLKDQPRETGVLEISSEQVASLHALGFKPPLIEIFFDPLQVTLTANGNPLRALTMGFQETWKMTVLVYMTIDRLLFTRSVGVEQLHGPVGIVHVGSRVADRGFMYLVFFLAMISVNLAVLNFLPLPIVDGGLFLYLVYEKFKGRPPSIAFQNGAALVGLLLIGTLFLVTFYNDIMRLAS
ncbi:MAG: site-2 protease family protein [Phycisphaerales bacterium]|nr:site-2 protease family protein [Phycisphaerales bacterium]